MVRDSNLWNIANDYVVNNDLIEAGVGQKIDMVPILYDHKYRGKFSEEIYEELVQGSRGERQHQVPQDL